MFDLPCYNYNPSMYRSKPRVRCYSDGSFLPQGLDIETITWAQRMFDAKYPVPEGKYRIWHNKFDRLRPNPDDMSMAVS